jgi:hypothetical protein
MLKLLALISLLCSLLVPEALGQMTDSAQADVLKKGWTASEDPPKTLACIYGTPGKQVDSIKIVDRCYSNFGAIYFTHDKSSWQENAELAMLCWLLNVKHKNDDVYFLGEMYGIVPATDSTGRQVRRPAVWGCWRPLTGDSTHASGK